MKLVFNEVTKDLVPDCVYSFCQKYPEIQVAEINPNFADGELLSQNYDIPYEMELNCLVVEGKRNEESNYAALLVPYGTRANMNAKVRNPLDAKKVSFANLDYVIQTTGMEFGSITPIGLPSDWKILVDASILEQEYVIVGGGYVKSKCMLPSKLFKEFENCIIVEGLSK